MSAWPDLSGGLSFLPDSQHIWHLIEALTFPVVAWEAFKYLYRWIFRRRSRLELRLDLAEEEIRAKTKEIGTLHSENRQLNAELENARGRLPQAAIARANHEWHNRNTILAIGQLERWFEANAESITNIALRLAKFHISSAIPDPRDHLDRTRDLLRLARGASPDNREVQELSSELDTVNAGLQEQLIRDGDVQIAWNSAMAPRLGAQAEAMLPAVNSLRAIADFCFEKGLWRLMQIFADRAADLALSGGVPLRRVWFSVESKAAFYQVISGHAVDGLQRVDHVLAEVREFLPSRDAIIFNARYIRAEALVHLGRYAEVLTEIDDLARVLVEVKGARHPDTLSTRYLRASTLRCLGCYSTALAEIDDLTPIHAEIKGARHPDMLATRWMRADVLSHLGRYADALLEIDNLAPLMVEVRGARHPQTLMARYLRAEVLNGLGRYVDALLEIDDLAPCMVAVKGARHPDVLLTRYLRAEVLSGLGRYADALLEIDDFAPVEVEVRGTRHPETLMTQHFRAICLANLGRWDEALGEIEYSYLIQLETLGASHVQTVSIRSARIGIEIAARRDADSADELREVINILGGITEPISNRRLLASRYRLSRSLFQHGHVDEARLEIVETIAHFDPMTDPNHGLLRSAKALLGLIEGRMANDPLTV